MLWTVHFQMFQELVLILVLFPMLQQIEILKILCVLVFELLEQRSVVADIELQQMANDMKWSTCHKACCAVGCGGLLLHWVTKIIHRIKKKKYPLPSFTKEIDHTAMLHFSYVRQYSQQKNVPLHRHVLL